MFDTGGKSNHVPRDTSARAIGSTDLLMCRAVRMEGEGFDIAQTDQRVVSVQIFAKYRILSFGEEQLTWQ